MSSELIKVDSPSQEVLTLLLDHARVNWMGKNGYQRYNAMIYINHLLDRWLEGQGDIPEPPIQVPQGYYHQDYNIADD